MASLKTLIFKKTGYEPFIDFLKAYSIIVVIFCHGFPYLDYIGYAIWGLQIPLFFLIQVFHCYKREPMAINWRMIGRRIMFPFFAVETLILFVKLGEAVLSDSLGGVQLLIKSGVKNGGYGPGSYYPWVYLQMSILILLMRPICERLEEKISLLLFLLISIVLEVMCSIANMPDFLYRLLCFRYIFLMWCGWIWVSKGIEYTKYTITASLVSLVAIIYFAYAGVDLDPWFYNTGWATHRWPCYFWVSWLFVGILYWIYKRITMYEKIYIVVKILAASSYEIFLVQMAYYAIIPLGKVPYIADEYIRFGTWFVLAFIVSVAGGVLLNRAEKYCFRNK